MGKMIRAQRLGKGTVRKSPSHRYRADVNHRPLKTSKQQLVGTVKNICRDPGRTAPLAEVHYQNGEREHIIAPLGLRLGAEVSAGSGSPAAVGNSTYISEIPEGTMVCNVEAMPGDGGKFARSSGTYVRIVTHDPNRTVVQLPSGAFKSVNPKCRASVGIVSGGGRKEKPFVKAGNKHKAKYAKGRLYPVVCGVNMNPVDHPYGGGNHPHTGKSRTVSRHAPPGRKIGSIAAKRSGRKK
jgi:large subunit ribosomal protein L2